MTNQKNVALELLDEEVKFEFTELHERCNEFGCMHCRNTFSLSIQQALESIWEKSSCEVDKNENGCAVFLVKAVKLPEPAIFGFEFSSPNLRGRTPKDPSFNTFLAVQIYIEKAVALTVLDKFKNKYRLRIYTTLGEFMVFLKNPHEIEKTNFVKPEFELFPVSIATWEFLDYLKEIFAAIDEKCAVDLLH